MSKPEDVPEQIWSDACDYALLVYEALGAHPPEHCGVETTIARAILAAKAEERDRCAKLTEEFAGQFPEYPEFDEQHNCAIYIASVIRGEADVNTAHKISEVQ